MLIVSSASAATKYICGVLLCSFLTEDLKLHSMISSFKLSYDYKYSENWNFPTNEAEQAALQYMVILVVSVDFSND